MAAGKARRGEECDGEGGVAAQAGGGVRRWALRPAWRCGVGGAGKAACRRYLTPDMSRTVGLIMSASTIAAPILKAATEPNRVGSGMEL